MSSLNKLTYPNLPECAKCPHTLKGQIMRECPICKAEYIATLGEQRKCPNGHSYWKQMEALGIAKIGNK